MHLTLPNTTELLLTVGYIGLFGLIFAETGLIIGLVLPGGETLAFTAGFLSSLGDFNIWIVIAIVFCAAILADSAEYAVGKKYGASIFDKSHSLFFDKAYITEAEDFYAKHGGKTILLARFLPFIRTLAPLFAGIGKMRYSSFVAWNLIGAFIWATGISLLGYSLGRIVPNADQYALWIVVAIALISLISPIMAVLQSGDRRRRLVRFIKERLDK
jgi:membrane-associated protein